MLAQLAGWKGSVEINGTLYDTIQEATRCFKASNDAIRIKLYPKGHSSVRAGGNDATEEVTDVVCYRIFVKSYMTKKAEPGFDFMAKWNNDIPMPYRIMQGEKIKETKGMVYMKLYADIVMNKEPICMKCGRTLTNPISQYFGVGPECGGHNYTNPFNSDAELKAAVAEYRKQLQAVTWEGWIVKSAIIREEVI